MKPPIDITLSQANPLHTLTPCLSTIRLVTFSSVRRFHQVISFLHFLRLCGYAYLNFVNRDSCSFPSIMFRNLLQPIALTTYGEVCKFYINPVFSFPSCCYLHFTDTKILLSFLFFKQFNLCPALRMKGQFSQLIKQQVE